MLRKPGNDKARLFGTSLDVSQSCCSVFAVRNAGHYAVAFGFCSGGAPPGTHQLWLVLTICS